MFINSSNNEDLIKMAFYLNNIDVVQFINRANALANEWRVSYAIGGYTALQIQRASALQRRYSLLLFSRAFDTKIPLFGPLEKIEFITSSSGKNNFVNKVLLPLVDEWYSLEIKKDIQLSHGSEFSGGAYSGKVVGRQYKTEIPFKVHVNNANGITPEFYEDIIKRSNELLIMDGTEDIAARVASLDDLFAMRYVGASFTAKTKKRKLRGMEIDMIIAPDRINFDIVIERVKTHSKKDAGHFENSFSVLRKDAETNRKKIDEMLEEEFGAYN